MWPRPLGSIWPFPFYLSTQSITERPCRHCRRCNPQRQEIRIFTQMPRQTVVAVHDRINTSFCQQTELSPFSKIGGDGQELSPLTKREKSLVLVDGAANRVLFFLEKLEGPLF